MTPPHQIRHWRIRARQHVPGDHVHVGIWVGNAAQHADRNGAKVGQLIMGTEDWPDFVRLLTAAPDAHIEIDAAQLLDWDGAGHPDADPYLAQPPAYNHSVAGPCEGLIGYERVTGHFPGTPVPDPAVNFTVPPDLTRVWVELAGIVVPRPGATHWAVTVLDEAQPPDFQPRYVIQGRFDATTPERVTVIRDDGRAGLAGQPGRWLDGLTPGQEVRLNLRLDGADWRPSSTMPVFLEVRTHPRPARPGYPLPAT